MGPPQEICLVLRYRSAGCPGGRAYSILTFVSEVRYWLSAEDLALRKRIFLNKIQDGGSIKFEFNFQLSLAYTNFDLICVLALQPFRTWKSLLNNVFKRSEQQAGVNIPSNIPRNEWGIWFVLLLNQLWVGKMVLLAAKPSVGTVCSPPWRRGGSIW
jgi:hypothetical protein